MADRRGAGQRQAGDDGQDGGEGHGRDEAQEQVAADRLAEVDGRHVGAADQVLDLVEGHRTVGTDMVL